MNALQPWMVNCAISCGILLGLIIDHWIVYPFLERLKEMRRQRHLAAEEVERILASETKMEERTFLDPITLALMTKKVPVGSAVLTNQQIKASDFNRLDDRIKVLEAIIRRTR